MADIFKHIVWMILTMVVFFSLVYVLLSQIGVISSSNSVFDVGDSEEVGDKTPFSGDYDILVSGRVLIYYIGEDVVTEEQFFSNSDIKVRDFKISEWNAILDLVGSSYKPRVMELRQGQHPLYDFS